MNARNLGFPTISFDIVLCGFMGWDDCFNFVNLKFTQPEQKAHEIWRVLRSGGKFICCSWDEQEDVTWMEEAILRYYPAILKDGEYLEQRPIGMSYEKALGYEVIFRNAGFRDIEIFAQSMMFVSTDEEEWWQQMQHLGWEPFLDRIGAEELHIIKDAIFTDLQPFKRIDGIHFKKTAFFILGVK